MGRVKERIRSLPPNRDKESEMGGCHPENNAESAGAGNIKMCQKTIDVSVIRETGRKEMRSLHA